MSTLKRQKVSHRTSAVKDPRVDERESSPAQSAVSEPAVEGDVTADATEEVTKSFKDLVCRSQVLLSTLLTPY
ncbi:hypothetical protein CTA2_499 [Colletotrichum tanaceti]|nr:hypothetical protein CTA2_499 [Colletotrichum tanaceti]